MGKRREIVLSDAEYRELMRMRNTSFKPYLRERAAAVLKVAEGVPAAIVARERLLRYHDPDTVYAWLNRFARRGIAGLYILPGRGRKAAFSPSVPYASSSQGENPRRCASATRGLRHRAQQMDTRRHPPSL